MIDYLERGCIYGGDITGTSSSRPENTKRRPKARFVDFNNPRLGDGSSKYVPSLRAHGVPRQGMVHTKGAAGQW